MSGSKLASLLLFILVLAVTSATAQTQSQSSQAQSQAQQVSATPAAAPAAKPPDVASPDAILAATYDVISGPAGKRDWDRFRSLFVPGARLIAVQKGKDGSLGARVFTPDDYITRGGPYFEKNGFFERGISARRPLRQHHASLQHLRIPPRRQRRGVVRARHQ